MHCLFKLLLLWFFGVIFMCCTTAKGVIVPQIETAVVESVSEPISWLQRLKELRKGVTECVKESKQTTIYCFKQRSLHMFSDVMAMQEIRIWYGVYLKLKAGQMEEGSLNAQRADLQYLTWFDRLAMILAHSLNTHILHINLKELADASLRSMEEGDKNLLKEAGDTADPIGEARMRRHRYNTMLTMMFGATALGAILVPLGFQLLSIVSGKALLLAKMALLLASINGLKKVANNGVHYGLYHVPGEHYSYYDRGDAHHPRTAPGLTLAQPIDVSIPNAYFEFEM